MNKSNNYITTDYLDQKLDSFGKQIGTILDQRLKKQKEEILVEVKYQLADQREEILDKVEEMITDANSKIYSRIDPILKEVVINRQERELINDRVIKLEDAAFAV